MKTCRVIILFVITFGLSLKCLKAQQSDTVKSFIPKGKIEGNIFANFYYGQKDGSAKTAFQITRAHLGYNYQFSESLSSRVLFDISSPKITVEDTLSGKSSLNHTAHLKFASLTYKIDQINISGGMIQLTQFKLQDKIWGRRYIMKTAQDEYGYSNVADIGARVEYTVSNKIALDFTVRNGEGFKSIQTDDKYWYGLNIYLEPVKRIHYKILIDYFKDSLNQYNLSNFVGFDGSKFKFGIEYIIGSNFKQIKNQKLYCLSVYSSYTIVPKFEIFARFDRLTSNRINGNSNNWNYKNDLVLFLGGVQFTPTKNITTAINLQHRKFMNELNGNEVYGFINVSFNF